MRNRQQDVPSEKSDQMVANLMVLTGTAYRRRCSNDNCQISLLDNFVNFLKVVRHLPKPHNAWKYFGYR